MMTPRATSSANEAALTVLQPLATLIGEQVKRHELRTWKIKNRYVWIHAGVGDLSEARFGPVAKRLKRIRFEEPQRFPVRVLIARVEIVAVHRVTAQWYDALPEFEKRITPSPAALQGDKWWAHELRVDELAEDRREFRGALGVWDLGSCTETQADERTLGTHGQLRLAFA